MKLLDYIRGPRKGKEAHQLERESMQDPFLADAMDGYSQVEGNHEQRIEQLRMQVSAHSAKKKNTYAITWSIAACLVIGFGISSYFLFLKKSMTDEVFIAEESVSTKLAEPATPPTPAIPATPTVPATPQKEIALAATKVKTDSTPISEITARQADKKDMIAKIQTTSQPQGAPVAAVPMMEEVSKETAALQEVVATIDTFESESDKKMKMAKVATILPPNNMIKGRVTDENKEQAKKEIAPQPVIGKRNYQKYLKENLVRPTDEKCAQVKGKVILTFLVNKKGRPFYIKVKESLCESADKEAIRLIQEGPDWVYGNKLVEVTVKFE